MGQPRRPIGIRGVFALISHAPQRLSIGFIEPHLLRFGGIRRVLELANRLVARGHAVTIYLPQGERLACSWMECRADIKTIDDGLGDALDVVVFNEESQWHQPDRFSRAAHRVFYALHYAKLYGKSGSWESIRTPVDLQLANSTWTADCIEAETGRRPTLLLGGINPDHFRPLDVAKRYPLLCVGDQREWKGTAVIEAAAELLGLPLERYAGKDLKQDEMAREYARAEVFVVGSRFEGFGQPGLEALACGVPLVTTDNGGCRDYAIDGETALVVPPDDPEAMAKAIATLRSEPELAERLIGNGLKLVSSKFDWDVSAAKFEELVMDLRSQPQVAAQSERGTLREVPTSPALSVVTPVWDQLHYTQRCVESIRQNTDVEYELILVDNGSLPDAAAYARQAGDRVVLNDANLGFSKGMNQGLELARGDYVAFINNDTVLPPGWASAVCRHFEDSPRCGIVVPAVTAAGNLRTVRAAPGTEVEIIPPFEAPPSAVVYVMRRDVAVALGGWGEEYEIASAEDVDLCFKVWVNDLDIVFDQRVLVEHAAKGTARAKLDDFEQLWAANRKILLAKWTAEDIDIPRLDSCPPDLFERNLQVARSVAGWMTMYFRARDRFGGGLFRPRLMRIARPAARRAASMLYRYRDRAIVRRALDLARRYPRLRSLLDRARS